MDDVTPAELRRVLSAAGGIACNFKISFYCISKNSVSARKKEVELEMNMDNFREAVRYIKIQPSNIYFLYMESDSPYVTVNYSFFTPTYNDKGISHIVEHCIASQINSPYILKRKETTYNERTSYSYVVLKTVIGIHRYIVQQIFYSNLTSNKAIFEIEGINLTRHSNQFIHGTVYNEMKRKFSNPYDTIVHSIPKSLYSNRELCNILGGLPDSMITTKYEDVVEYYTKYYIPQNSIIFVEGTKDAIKAITEIIKEAITSFSAQKDCYWKNNLKTINFNEKNHLEISYSYRGESLSPSMCLSFPIPLPENILLYDVIQSLCNLIYNSLKDTSLYDGLGSVVNSGMIFNFSTLAPYISFFFLNSKIDYNIFSESIIPIVVSKLYNIHDLIKLREHDILKMDSIVRSEYMIRNFLFSGQLNFDKVNLEGYLEQLKDYSHKIAYCSRGIICYPEQNRFKFEQSYLNNKKEEKFIYNTYYKQFPNYGYVYKDLLDDRKFLKENSNIRMSIVEKIRETNFFWYQTYDVNKYLYLYFDISDLDNKLIALISLLCEYFEYNLSNKKNFSIYLKPIGDSLYLSIMVHDYNLDNNIIKKYLSFLNYTINRQEKHINDFLTYYLSKLKLNIFRKPYSYAQLSSQASILRKSFYINIMQGLAQYNILNHNRNINILNEIFDYDFLCNRCRIASIYSEEVNTFKHLCSSNLYYDKVNKKNYIPRYKNNMIVMNNEWYCNSISFRNESLKESELQHITFRAIIEYISTNYLFPSLKENCCSYSLSSEYEQDVITLTSAFDCSPLIFMNCFRNIPTYLNEHVLDIWKVLSGYIFSETIKSKRYKSSSLNDLSSIFYIQGNETKTNDDFLISFQDYLMIINNLKECLQNYSLCSIGKPKFEILAKLKFDHITLLSSYDKDLYIK